MLSVRQDKHAIMTAGAGFSHLQSLCRMVKQNSKVHLPLPAAAFLRCFVVGLRLWFAGDPPGTDKTDVTVNEVTTTTANLWDWEQTTLTVGGVTHSLGSMQRVWKCASSTGDATYEWISPTPLQGRVVTFTVASSVEGDRRLKHVEFGK